MQKKIGLLLLFFSLSFYGQNDTISVEKTSIEIVESVDTTNVVYQGLDNKYSIFRLKDTISDNTNSNISVVSADKMNVVYRGLSNLISIAVPNCKSFTASGNGLYKYAEGKYQLLPGSGTESIIIIDIVSNDGSTKKEVFKFRIKNIPRISGAINGLTCNQSVILMCKEELKNAIISIDFPKDFLYELKFNLKKFTVNLDDKRYFIINRNKFTDEVFNEINKLKTGSIFTIKVSLDSIADIFVTPIKIMIIEDKNYHKYEEDK